MTVVHCACGAIAHSSGPSEVGYTCTDCQPLEPSVPPVRPKYEPKTINVGELKRLLADIPDETPLFVDGYESGLQNLGSAEQVLVKLNANRDEYGGPHVQFDPTDPDDIRDHGGPDGAGVLLR